MISQAASASLFLRPPCTNYFSLRSYSHTHAHSTPKRTHIHLVRLVRRGGRHRRRQNLSHANFVRLNKTSHLFSRSLSPSILPKVFRSAHRRRRSRRRRIEIVEKDLKKLILFSVVRETSLHHRRRCRCCKSILFFFVVGYDRIGDRAVVVVKWSACSPSIPIRVRILLKYTVLF